MQAISVDDPVLVNQTANGMLFLQNSVEPPLYITHVYGTPYEMGYAQGVLLKEQINQFIPDVFEYMYTEVEDYLGFLPYYLQEVVAEVGVDAALDMTYELTKPYTPDYYYEEMQGLADGSGVPYKQILQVHMLPELIKAHCSIIGAWGPAISGTSGSLYQLRALDWSTNGPFQAFPALTVYHPEEGNGHDFAILGWTGFIGALTGYSSASVGICEKVWLSYNGTYSRAGIPWMFVLRDILQYDTDIDSAINRLNKAERTCSIFVGLGDNSINQARILEYSHDFVNVGDDKNFPEWDEHPSMDGVVYLDKHSQPSTDTCMGGLLETYYGDIDALKILQYIAPRQETGDMHVAVYDYAENYMYVSNASPVPPNGNATQVVPAYNRPYIRLDMNQLFGTNL